MKKIILLLLVVFFVVLVTAPFEFDNTGDYDEEKKQMTITNSFGFGDDIAIITLNSPKNVNIFPGRNRKVAEFTIEGLQNYTEVFNGLEFYDINNNQKGISRSFTYKYKTTKLINEPTYTTNCEETAEGRLCISERTGTKKVSKDVWNDFDKDLGLTKGIITIGIFTDVLPGDYIDWIPTFYGVKINEWATWSSTLGDGIIAYYTLNETTGATAEDASQNDPSMDLTLINMENGDWVNGFIANGLNFSKTEGPPEAGFSAGNTDITGSGNRSVFLWVNTTGCSGSMAFVSFGGVGNFVESKLACTGSQLRIDTINSQLLSATGHLPTGEWTFVGYTTQTYNSSSAEVRIYVNNTQVAVSNLSFSTANSHINIGNASSTLSWEYSGVLDEIMIYNRTLTPLEIKEIYNDGFGLSFGDTSEGDITVNLITPTSGSSIFINNFQEFNSTINPSVVNITNATLFIWNSTSGIENKTTNIVTGESLNSTTWNVSMDFGGNKEWNVFACGLNGSDSIVCSFANSNNTFIVKTFTENSQTFNATSSETDKQTFKLNLTTSSASLTLTANLNYNGTLFVADVEQESPNIFILSKAIDIPLVVNAETQNKSFQWNITTFDGTSSINLNSVVNQQNVSRIHFVNCTSAQTTIALNFTAFDEQNLTRISPYSFNAFFDVWLGGGSVKRNSTLSESSATEINVCLFPNRTMFVDSQIEYDEITSETNYTTRNYFLQNNSVSNETQDIPLYLLESASSTSFILKVQNDNLLPLENHLILIQRFYPGENTFRTVQVAKTDGNGKSIGFFETETVDYRFIIRFNDELLLVTTLQKIIGESAPFTLTFTIGADLGKPWEDLEDLPKLTSNLFHNKTTNTVIFTYSDTSGNFTRGRLVVELQNISSPMNLTICNEESSQSSATITCAVGVLTDNRTGTYTARGLITRTGSGEVVVSIINLIIQTFSDVAGLLGVFLAWFLILISSFAFKFNEIAGIFMVNATIIFVNMMGLVSFGALAISAIIAVSIIIVAVLEK